jgi:hypothetical protein
MPAKAGIQNYLKASFHTVFNRMQPGYICQPEPVTKAEKRNQKAGV